MSRNLPTKVEILELKIRQLDKSYRNRLKECSEQNQRIMELNESLSHQVFLLKHENEQLRKKLYLPERRYEARAPPILRSSSLEYEPEQTLRF